MEKTALEVEYLNRLFKYDPSSGKLTRIISTSHRVKIGDEVGTVNHYGYKVVSILNHKYQVHRIVWAMTHGTWPIDQIDHINGNRSDNRIENLRDVTCRDNKLNLPIHRAGRLFGCTKNKNKWQVQICIGKKYKYIGLFATEQEAHEAYLSASKELL